MTDFPFDQPIAGDPSNPALLASNGVITVFEPGDATKTPLALKTLDGQPMPNPITVNFLGMGPAFIAPLWEVAWEGGGLSGLWRSNQGLRDQAVAAVTAAELAQAAAETAATGAADAASTALAGAVADAESAQAAAAAAAALVGAPADAAMAAAANNTGSAFRGALNATYASYIQLAKNPDTLIAGAVTVDANDLVTSAAVVWPDGSPGTLTITSRDVNNAVLAYNITYGSPVTKTFTQPTITRNSNGAATNVPQIVVS